MTNFTKALEDEVDRLERELQQSPLYMKWTAARQLLAAYKGENIGSAPPAPPSAEVTQPVSQRLIRESASRAGSGKVTILHAVREWIAGRSEPTSTADLLSELQRRNIEVGGVEPRNTLSSMLSRSDEFESHGRAGWTLKSGPAGHESEKADDTNPAEGSSSALFENRTDHPVTPPAQGREAGPGGGT